ncbi:MAG: sugar phosphate nucleotidyltransferase [Leptospiraceae bacterium]|nr:sugar phosphate nucleotidyltransferase [Leptospiraceae bacterium]
MKDSIIAVILAAGKGTRMKSELPKVATLLAGKPLIQHVIDNLKLAGVTKIVVVVGYKKEVVINLLSNEHEIEFAEQKEQLGTGHALLSTESILVNYHGQILVCCGDVPLISGNSFRSLINHHVESKNGATVLSADMPNPKGYGRIIRDKNDKLLFIVEEKDANEDEKKVSEINTGTYVFESPKVFEYLKTIKTNNAQGEYYLPDLIKIYRENQYNVDASLLKNSVESSGVNSPEDLQYLNSILEESKVSL